MASGCETDDRSTRSSLDPCDMLDWLALRGSEIRLRVFALALAKRCST
jgi:hypothetical protein